MNNKHMDTLIRLDELGLFALTVLLFSRLGYPWWLYPLLLFVPDISIMGYMINPAAGTYCYNFIHHRGIAVMLYTLGTLNGWRIPALIGLILFAHSCLDRIFGMGLRHPKGFRNSYTGRIGGISPDDVGGNEKKE